MVNGLARYWWIKAMAMLPSPTPLDTCLMELWRTFSGSSLPEARQAEPSGRQDPVLTSEARPNIPIGPRSSPVLRPTHHPEAHGPQDCSGRDSLQFALRGPYPPYCVGSQNM